MSVNGVYKIDIELTARKQVLGLVGTAQKLLGHVGVDMPEPPGVEEHIRSVVESFKADREVFDAFEMTITDTTITVKTNDGVTTHKIMGKTEEGNNHLVLVVQDEDMNEFKWDVTFSKEGFVLDSIDGFSEYAYMRK